MRLITKLSYCSAFSSIDPTLLYMKKLESNIANEKIRTSWFESSSSAPKPSVSRTNTFMGSPSGVVPSIGLPQIHTPYMKKLVKLFLLLVKQIIWNFEVSMICLSLEMQPYLCTCIDRWPNIKSSRLIEQHSVKKIAFTRAVHSGNRNYSNWWV